MIRRKQSGFTLIEVMVVVAIIGILVGVAVGQYQRSILKAREATLKENLYVMRTAINQYFADKGQWPGDLYALEEDHYIQKIPVDQMTGSADTWTTEIADVTEQDISTEPGIADVRSGATGVSPFDGSSYSEW